MRNRAMQQPETSCNALWRHGSAYCGRSLPALASAVAFAATQFLFGATLNAQTPATPAATPSVPTAAPTQKPAPAPGKPVAAEPAAQPKPDWPADNQPSAASVDFDSRGLLVVASNSSLDQILREISIKTGIKVQGMGEDERVFGSYGPGPASDVLSELLDGSGYNVLMIGDQGGGTPRQIVLTARSAVTAPPPGNSPSPPDREDTEAEQPEPPLQQPPLPEPLQAGTPPPGVPARTPQQVLQEMQQREQQIQQQEQQQHPQN